jgi:hypothetical protein
VSKIVEMRTYKTKTGRRTEFLEIFHTKSVPGHQEIRMKILGPFPSLEDPDTLFFMPGFPDLPSRLTDEGKILRRRTLERRAGKCFDAHVGQI